MVKTRDLKRHLRSHGCEMLREGRNHEIWRNPVTGGRAPVARHRDIPRTTANQICAQLGVSRFG